MIRRIGIIVAVLTLAAIRGVPPAGGYGEYRGPDEPGDAEKAYIGEALRSEDPEAALIQLLYPPEKGGPVVRVIPKLFGDGRPQQLPPGVVEVPLSELQGFGKLRPPEPLIVQKLALEQLVNLGAEGTAKAIEEILPMLGDKVQIDGQEAGWQLWPPRGDLEGTLFVIRTRLDFPDPKEQALKIGDELDALNDKPWEPLRKEDYARTLINYLGELAVPEGFPPLHRAYALNLQLPHEEMWFPTFTAVKAMGKIGDPNALSIIEQVFPMFIGPSRDWEWASEVWWEIKLKTVAEAQWPDLLYDQIISLQPPAGMNVEAGARLIGPACIPRAGEALLDRTPRAGVSRASLAARALGALADPAGTEYLVALALDRSRSPLDRDCAFNGLARYENEEGLLTLLGIAQAAAASGDIVALREAGGALPAMLVRMEPLSLSDAARNFIEGLKSSSNELLRLYASLDPRAIMQALSIRPG